MAKITIYFNNNEYKIDETLLAESSAALVRYLTTEMAGEGASVTFNGTSYSIDATKLNAANANLIAHLGTISGTDKTITINGESYGINAAAIEDSVAGFETFLTELKAESGGETSEGYLTFSSPSSFTLNIADNAKYWDGTLEYSTDASTWNEWDGTTTLSANNGVLYMRGTGNTYITGSSAYDTKAVWRLTGNKISCVGNIENLLDYATVANGEHPVMADHCYYHMFNNCTSLIAAPELPATTLADYCYSNMFYGCTNLKLSAEQTDEYTIVYRIPTSGTGTTATDALTDMFTSTGGTFTGTPEINTTYYLHKSNSVLNEHGFYYDTPYSAEVQTGVYYHIVLKEGGTAEMYLTAPVAKVVGIPVSALAGSVVQSTWTYNDDSLVVDMMGNGSEPITFAIANNGLTLTDGTMNFVCTFEEYSDIYFGQTYYSYTNMFPDVIFNEDGSAVLGDQTYPAGALTYGSHIIYMGSDYVFVSMDGKDIYLGETKIGSLTPCSHNYTSEVIAPTCEEQGYTVHTCSLCGSSYTDSYVDALGHDYQEVYECLTSSTHRGTKTCSRCGSKQTIEEEAHSDLNGDGSCDLCGWNANTRAIAGLYETGTTNLISSWDKLKSDNIIVTGNKVYVTDAEGQRANLCGDLVIPEGYTSIRASAFYGCTGLTSVVIPNSVTSIEYSAFAECTSLINVTIGNGVTEIGYQAFYKCSSLTSINIPDSVTSIGNFVFYDCSNLTSINIPDSVTSIGDGAFHGCSNLMSISIPDGVTEIGYQAFYGCSSLTSITIPDSVTSIGLQAFSECSSLTSITIPDSVTSIGDSAFYGCTGLTSINIPESVTSIGEKTFYGCSSLTSINIPDSVTSIGDRAFEGCSRLNAVHITDIAAWCGISFGGNNANPLYYAHNLYLNGELVTEIVIPDSVTSIGDSVFSGCSSLTSITIPDSVTSIGRSAFSGCSSLTSINIPDGVTSIGGSAFRNCSSLTSINIPDGVTSIGGNAFRGCSSLTSINIPDGVTEIGDWAFRDCSSLTSINIPDGVTSIGAGAFQGCSSLTSINIPDGVTSIGDNAFHDCTSLTSITIPDGVTSIGRWAFEGCYSLTSITIPDSVTSIGNNAFKDCTGLTSITIPDGMTSIATYAFLGCTGLTSISFEGTKAQWEAIEKNGGWNYYVPATEVICSDGTVAL